MIRAAISPIPTYNPDGQSCNSSTAARPDAALAGFGQLRSAGSFRTMSSTVRSASADNVRVGLAVPTVGKVPLPTK